jgi:[FeFe] hydrogenase H-cluster maturation GTPase HydF
MKSKDLKPHIGIFGRRNIGKSSLINTMVNQEVAIVSNEPGTTTDPVKKSIEIFGIGPVIITDTAGIDDVGKLGIKRVDKSFSVIPNIDFGILLIANNEFGYFEIKIINEFENYDIPYIIVHGKSDEVKIKSSLRKKIKLISKEHVIEFNIFDKLLLEKLLTLIIKKMPKNAYNQKSLLKGIIKAKELVLLITPIDSEAPEGRMILPQVMALRDVLDNDALCMIVKETELNDFLKLGIKPAIAITDSQVFAEVSKILPPDVMLTSFSIMLARYRGNFEKYIEGTPHIENLKDGDRILMLESCTHQVSCEDIGRYKLPKWLANYTGKKLQFDFAAGLTKFPNLIENYAMIIQCGGCVVTQKQLNNRLLPAVKKQIPVSNYGMAIAYVTGIFERVVEPFVKK